MAKVKDAVRTILKKKTRKGVAKKHPNKHETNKQYVGQGRY